MPHHTAEPLNELKALRGRLAAKVSKPIQFPEPSLKLDPDSRRNSTVRLFTHFHQMCFGHALLFGITNQIKLVYLIDAYVCMAEGQNPFGMYGSARALLEFNAFLHEVS